MFLLPDAPDDFCKYALTKPTYIVGTTAKLCGDIEIYVFMPGRPAFNALQWPRSEKILLFMSNIKNTEWRQLFYTSGKIMLCRTVVLLWGRLMDDKTMWLFFLIT